MEQPPPYPGPQGQEIKQTAPTYPQQPGYQTQTTTIIQQPAQVFVGLRFLESPVAMTCPFCQASIVTSTVYTNGTLTWIACGGVALMGGWLGCCLVPFCMDSLKDVIHNCPNCQKQVGVYRRV